MADTAAHLVDRVLPEAPVRQRVLTLPYALRYRGAYDARLTSEVLRAFIRALFAELRRRARRLWGVRAEQCGAVTFIQRFGSALDLNVHFHTLALDGVYTHAVGQVSRPDSSRCPLPRRTRWHACSRAPRVGSSACSRRARGTTRMHLSATSL